MNIKKKIYLFICLDIDPYPFILNYYIRSDQA